MSATPDRLTRLREFGLSEYAARAYLALLDLGITDARDISSLSKVPQAKIYHVLEQLGEKGLVTVLPEFPKKYAPVPFEDYLGRIFDEHTRAAQTIEAEREALGELFRVVGDVEAGDRGFFTVLQGRRNIIARIDEVIGKVERDFLIMATANSAPRFLHFIPALKRARERGVQTRILAPLDANNTGGFGLLGDIAEIRERHLPADERGAHVGIFIADAKVAFLVHWVPDDSSLSVGKDTGVFTDQEAMVAAIGAIVEPHWSRAATFAQRREEIQSGRPAEFTRIYTHAEDAWRALLAAVTPATREVRTLDAQPRSALAAEERELLDAVRRAGARWLSVVNLPDAAAARSHEAISTDAHIELRHSAASTLSRKWIVDGREAIVALTPRTGPSLYVHTTQAAVVESLRARFDAAWEASLPFAARTRELELFPRLAPSDLGIGPLFHAMPDAVIVSDATGHIRLWNAAASHMFGYSAIEALDLRIQDLSSADFHVVTEASLARAALPGSAPTFLEGVATRKGGARLDVEWTAAGLVESTDGAPLLISIVRDVTERRRARELEREANAGIIRVYERMNEAFVALDTEFRFVYLNPIAEKMRSTPKEVVLGQVMWDVYPELVGTKYHSEYTRAMRERVPVRVVEHFSRVDRWFEANAYPSDDGLSIFFRDITESKIANDAALQGEERFRRAFLDSPVAVAIIGKEGQFVEANAACCALLGRDRQALLSMRETEVVHADDVANSTRAADAESFESERRFVAADGRVIRAHVRGSALHSASGAPAEFVLTIQPVSVVEVREDAAEKPSKPKARRS